MAKTNFDSYVRRGSKDSCRASMKELRLDECFQPLDNQWAIRRNGVAVELTTVSALLDGTYAGQPTTVKSHEF